MQIRIKETNELKELALIYPETNQEYTADFIENHNGLTEFEHHEDVWITTLENFEWWAEVINNRQKLEYRLHDLIKTHGFEKIAETITISPCNDIEEETNNINRALDEEFEIINE